MAQCGAATTRGGSCRNAKWSCPNHAMPQWIALGLCLFGFYAVTDGIQSGEITRGESRFPHPVLEVLQTATIVGLCVLAVMTVVTFAANSRGTRKFFYQALLVVGAVTGTFLYGVGFF